MKNNSIDRIINEKEIWNKIASDYDNNSSRFESAYKESIKRCKNIFKGDEKVLDIACGTGIITFPLAKNVSHITGIDISEEMIRIAQNKISENSKSLIDFKVCDGYNTNYDDESFDAILLFNVLHVVEEPEKLLKETYRILKHNGHIITATDCYDEKLSMFKKIYHLVPKLMKKMNRVKFLNCYKREDLNKLLEENNFRIEDKDILFDAPLNYYISASKK